MPKMLTDGKIKIGAMMLPGRKKPCLCIEEGNKVVIYGHFNTESGASEFIDRLGTMVGAEVEEDGGDTAT